MTKPPLEVLKHYWGYSGFRGSQLGIIESALNGKDTIALLPTGGGKSLCYQVPGTGQPGLCLVVSPLLALMEDQVADLKSRGIKALALSGRLSREEVLRSLDNADFGKYDFLYLSPERLQQDLVLERIKRLDVNLIAIDEAHCISQWGFDFRPAYLNCAVLRDLFPGIPFMALTATATQEVLEDIEKLLILNSPVVFKDSVHRSNITYSVLRTEDKNYRLRTLLSKYAGSAIVYVQTRRATVNLSRYLSGHNLKSEAFHGGLDADKKRNLLKEWQSGSLTIMVATNAFGMGIDKSDVRLVVHFEVPETLENYFQEAGRAGRDGLPAQAILLLSPGDIERTREQYLGNLPGVKDVLKTYAKLNAYFQLPYGELPEGPFTFRLTEFCEVYDLTVPLTYNTLELLDRQGIISLSRQFWQSTRIRFICRKDSLWKYLETYPKFQPVVQTLLRTYGGLFDFETPVNLRTLSRKVQLTESSILELLKQLHKDGIIQLETSHGDLEIRFLVPREDEKTIYAISGQIKSRLKVKHKKVDLMASYLKNNLKCRELQLLAYFGEEKVKPCGTCDVCLSKMKTGKKATQSLKASIVIVLSDGPKTSRQILEIMHTPETETLHCLQKMLGDGILTLGAENQYNLS